MTKTELITWHKYPEEKPKEIKLYLVQVEYEPGKLVVLALKPFYENWREDCWEGDVIPSGQVVAWAEMPNGWKEE